MGSGPRRALIWVWRPRRRGSTRASLQQNWPGPEGLAARVWGPNLGRLTRREAAALRLATRHDAAFGSPEFVEEMERKYGVQLHAKPLGRPRKPPQAEAALTASATVSA